MANHEPVAWVFNLDAEDELSRGGAHTPSASMMARIETLLPRLESLLGPQDMVLWPGTRSGKEIPKRGQAWCPTRWALGQLEKAGVQAWPSPSFEVLRVVNHRRFNHQLGQRLPAAGYAENEEALAVLLSAHSELERTSSRKCWLLKRPFGFAGRGQRKLGLGALSPADQAWVTASLRAGDGLQVEPWVDKELEVGLHGWLTQDGTCTWGQPTVQIIDAMGTWQNSSVASPDTLSESENVALHMEARRVAEALHHAGYFGPFGVDAFRWRSADGRHHFQPRSEINARYSMGWAVGMGGFKPACI